MAHLVVVQPNLLFSENQGTYVGINRRFEDGIFADITGNAEYTVVFK